MTLVLRLVKGALQEATVTCNTRLKHCNLEAQHTQGSQITCKTHSDNVPLTALCLGSC